MRGGIGLPAQTYAASSFKSYNDSSTQKASYIAINSSARDMSFASARSSNRDSLVYSHFVPLFTQVPSNKQHDLTFEHVKKLKSIHQKSNLYKLKSSKFNQNNSYKVRNYRQQIRTFSRIPNDEPKLFFSSKSNKSLTKYHRIRDRNLPIRAWGFCRAWGLPWVRRSWVWV